MLSIGFFDFTICQATSLLDNLEIFIGVLVTLRICSRQWRWYELLEGRVEVNGFCILFFPFPMRFFFLWGSVTTFHIKSLFSDISQCVKIFALLHKELSILRRHCLDYVPNHILNFFVLLSTKNYNSWFFTCVAFISLFKLPICTLPLLLFLIEIFRNSGRGLIFNVLSCSAIRL